jgi:flagellar P-ring protein precursor FlgI
MAAIEMIEVTPAEAAAKVIVNSRTGTVVINSAVRLSPAAVSHGKLVVRIDEKPARSPALSNGSTAVTPNSKHHRRRGKGPYRAAAQRRVLVQDRRRAQSLGVTPSDLVAILEVEGSWLLKAEMVII